MRLWNNPLKNIKTSLDRVGRVGFVLEYEKKSSDATTAPTQHAHCVCTVLLKYSQLSSFFQNAFVVRILAGLKELQK